MAAQIDSVSTATAPRSERTPLALAVLASALLPSSLWVWGGRHESALFLLPLLACGLATVAMVKTLLWQQAEARRSLVSRTALAIGCLALVGPGMIAVFSWRASAWIGLPACLLVLSIFFLPFRPAAPGLPLALGLVSILAWLASLGVLCAIHETNAFDAMVLVTLGCQVLALLGVEWGSAALARGVPLKGPLFSGIALNTTLLLAPILFVLLAILSDD